MYQKDGEVTFSIVNEGNTSALMQLWIDKDDILSKPENIKLPFVFIPPLFKIGPKDTRVVLVKNIGDEYAIDNRIESIFWLNSMEIPPKTTNFDNDNSLQFAFRTRVKFFYRPKYISNYKIEDSVLNIKKSLVNCSGEKCLRLENNSPLHVNMLKIKSMGTPYISELPNDGIIPPYSHLDIKVQSKFNVQELTLIWIDDFGVLNTVII